MNTSRAFKVMGLEPTTDFTIIKDVYRNQYKKLQRSIAKARSQNKPLEKLEEKLQELNQAINHFELRKNNLENEVSIAKYTTNKEEEYISIYGSKVGKQLLDAELHGISTNDMNNLNKNFMTSINKSISINWKHMDMPVEADEVTLGVYLRGGKIMIKDELVDIPQGFEGVYVRTMKNGDIQFISIKIKTSVTFELRNNGDLILKALPEKHTKENGGVQFTFSGTDFKLDKDTYRKTLGTGVKIFDTDIYKYGTKDVIKVEVHPGTEFYSLV